MQPPAPGPTEAAIPQQHSLLPQAPQPARQPVIDTSFGLPSERAYQQAEEAQRQQQARPATLLPRNPAEFSAETAQPERAWLDYPKDIGVGALKTSIGFTQGLQGLANMPTLGKFGQLTEKLGYKPAEAQAILDSMYSPAQQYASRQVNEAKGFIPTIQKSLEYPSTIVQAVGESSASMLGGMGAGRLVLSKAPTLVTALSGRLGMAAETVAGAIGEGAISAGALAEGIREQTEKGDLSLGQSALALAGGIGTGVLSMVGGKISDSGGFADIDSFLLGSGAMKKPVKAAKAIVAGGITEGLEEMPQEIQEQVVENAALGRPLMQGVPESAAQALLAGAAMGSGANIMAGVAGQERGVDDQGETATATTQPASQPPVTEAGTASEMVETVINGLNTGQLNPDDPVQAEIINSIREQMRAVVESPSPEVQEVVAKNRDVLERIGALEPKPTGATGEQQVAPETDQAAQFEASEPQFPEEVALARAQAIQPKDRTKEEAELVKNYQERVEAEELALRRARAIDEQYRTPEEQEIVRSAEQREQEGYAKEELKAGQTAQATEETGAQPGKGKLPPVESLAGVVDFKNTSLDELQGIVRKVQGTPFEQLSGQEKRVAEAIAKGGQEKAAQPAQKWSDDAQAQQAREQIIRKQAEAASSEHPAHRSMTEAIKQGGINLDLARKEGWDLDTLKDVRRPGLFSKKATMGPDEMAQTLGYDSEADMRAEWVKAPTKKELKGRAKAEYTGQDQAIEESVSSLEKEGFELGTEDAVNVGDLNPGDEVVVMDRRGVPDKLTHKGYAEDGDALLQDGVTIKADPFEEIKIIAKKTGDTEASTIAQQKFEEILEETDPQRVKSFANKLPREIKNNPKLKPFQELIEAAVDRRLDALGVKTGSRKKDKEVQPDDAGAGGKGGDGSRDTGATEFPNKRAVETALRRGEDVPQEVMEQYPELAPASPEDISGKEGVTERLGSVMREEGKGKAGVRRELGGYRFDPKKFHEQRRNPEKLRLLTDNPEYKRILPENTEKIISEAAKIKQQVKDAEASLEDNKAHLVRFFDKEGVEEFKITHNGLEYKLTKPEGGESYILTPEGKDAKEEIYKDYQESGKLKYIAERGVGLRIQPNKKPTSKVAPYATKTFEQAAREHIDFVAELAEAREKEAIIKARFLKEIAAKLPDNGMDHVFRNKETDTAFNIKRNDRLDYFIHPEDGAKFDEIREKRDEAFYSGDKEDLKKYEKQLKELIDPDIKKEVESKITTLKESPGTGTKEKKQLGSFGVGPRAARGFKGEGTVKKAAAARAAAEAELDQILKSISGTPLPQGQRADIMGELTKQLGRGVLAQQKRGVFEVVPPERAAQAVATMSDLKKSMSEINGIPVISDIENIEQRLIDIFGEEGENFQDIFPHGGYGVGFRGIHPNQVGLKELPPSVSNVEGFDEEMLPGTSVVDIEGDIGYGAEEYFNEDNDVRELIKLAKSYATSDYVAVVVGERSGPDVEKNDEGEEVLIDAKAVAYIKVSDIEAKYSKDGQRIEALYFPKTGKVWLVDGNIEKGEAVGVLAHDLGVHALQLGFKETEAFERILKRVEYLVKKGNDPKVNAAHQRAIDAKTPANQLAEETLGYLMNNAKQHHLIRRLWAALKRFLSQKTNWNWASIEKFTPADMQAMAQSAIRTNVSPVARTVSSATAGVNEFAQSVKVSTAKAANKIKGMANFKTWFGDSKVVDENGEPLVVYHGTAGELKNNSFDPKRIGDIFNNDEYGFFFTNNTRHSPFEDAQSAGAYAQNAAYETDKAPNIIPAYISLQNPLIIDSAEKNFGGRISVDYLENVYGKNRLFNNIRNNGHDGALIIDRDSKGNDGNPETIVVAMRPTQIKSIFNTGEWSPTDPDIMKSYAKDQAQTADEIIFKAAYDASGEGEYRPYLDILANSGLSDKEFGDILENLLVSGKVSLSDDALSLRWNVQESTNPPVKPVDPADEVPRVSLENMSEIIGVDKAVLKREFDKVKNDRAEEIGKAPNGKKSNLGDNLWVMVRTPRFKKWFGDWEKAPENSSKVVDENGEPKFITRYGNNKTGFLRGFEETKKEWERGESTHGRLRDRGLVGIWFYTDYKPWDTGPFGNVKTDAFINMRNPLPKKVSRSDFKKVVNDQGVLSRHLSELYSSEVGKKIDPEKYNEKTLDDIYNHLFTGRLLAVDWLELIEGYSYGSTWNEPNETKAIEQRLTITKSVKELGYDGYKDDFPAFIVFDTKQVKSIENVGSFSQAHPNIMFSMSAPAQQTRRNTENLNATKDGKTSTTSPEAGEKAIQSIMATLRKVTQKTEAELDKSKAKEKKLLDQYRTIASGLEAVPIEESVNLLNGLVRQADIPDGSKKRIGQLIKSITAAKRPETQRKRLSNALETLRSDISKRLRSQIRAQVKRAAGPKREGVIKRGRYWHEQEKDIAAIREIVHNMSPEQATETISRVENRLDGLHERLKKAAPENAETIRNQITDAELRLHHLRTFGGLKSKSLEELLDAKYQIEELRRLGRSRLRAVKEAWQQEIDRKTNWLAQEITGQDDPRPETVTQYNRRKQKERSLVGRAKGAYQAVENSIQSWEHLLDRITIKSGKKIFQSRAVKELGSMAHAATRGAERYNRETTDQMLAKGLKIFGVKKGSTLTKRLQKLAKKTGKIQVAGDTLQLSPMEAAYFYNVRKDPGSEKLFRKMGFTPETWSGIDSLMTKELRAWADYLHDDLLADALQGETEAYRAVNGVDRVPVGLLRDDQTDIPVMNLNSAVMNRIFDANHYRAWAVPSKTFNDLFSVPETRGYIEQYAGTSTLKALDRFLEDFAKTPRELRGDMAWMDKLRSNVVMSMIGANPTTFFKQLTSIPAYAADIPTAAFVKNFAHGLANFGAVRRMIKDSQMARERFGSGYDRDIHEASKATAEQVIGGKITNMRDLLMAMTKLGDMAAVYAGYTVYKYHYDKNGGSKNHKEAHRIGIEEFERATERTQQAAGVKDRGSFERGSSLQKLLTMYMTSPAAYTRQTMAALRHFKTDPVGSSKRLLLFNVLLPMTFQAVASGFVGASGEDDEQWEEFWAKELRAVALGPFLGLPIARDIAAGLWDSAMGEWYGSDVQHSPVTETTKSLTQAVFYASKGLREFDDEAIERAKGELLDFLGYAAGLPIKPGRRVLEGLEDFLSGDTEHPLLALSGYSRAVRDERYLGD